MVIIILYAQKQIVQEIKSYSIKLLQYTPTFSYFLSYRHKNIKIIALKVIIGNVNAETPFIS
jgi:hypothetical protein